MTQQPSFHSGGPNLNYTIDHWSPPSSPSGASPSSTPPSNPDDFSSNFQHGQQNYSQSADLGRTRLGSDATQYRSSAYSAFANTRKFSMNNRNGYYNSASGQNSHRTFLDQVKELGPFQPGMKEVPIWLKNLRLHKYTSMFQPMSYAEMMALTEEQLDARQVTKGARKKILQSIDKLRERVPNIKQLEKSIDENGDPRCLIVELRAVMNTPIAKYSMENTGVSSDTFHAKLDGVFLLANEVDDENLPGHLVRILYKLHNHLFANTKSPVDLEDEYIMKLIQTYDKVLNSDSFTSNQKQHVSTFKRLLRRVATDRDILPYNSERRHTFSSNYRPTIPRPRRTSINMFNQNSSQTGLDNRSSPPHSNSPTPPAAYNPGGRRHTFSYSKYPPSKPQNSPQFDQFNGINTRPAPWYRPPQQQTQGLSPAGSPPHTPPGFSHRVMPSPPHQSPNFQQTQAGFTYPTQNNVRPQPGSAPDMQAILNALSNPQVLELIKNLSAKQQQSQREMVSQGIQAGTPEVHMNQPNFTQNPNVGQQFIPDLADQMALSHEEKLKLIQHVLNEDLTAHTQEMGGSKLPALNQLHQKTGSQCSQSAFKPIQQTRQMNPESNASRWFSQIPSQNADNKTAQEAFNNAGPSLIIPSIGYLNANAHREFVNKLWEPVPCTPPVLNPCTPQIDSKPLFTSSPSVQYQNPQPPIGTKSTTGANRSSNNNQSNNPTNAPPFDFSTLLMASPLR